MTGYVLICRYLVTGEVCMCTCMCIIRMEYVLKYAWSPWFLLIVSIIKLLLQADY